MRKTPVLFNGERLRAARKAHGLTQEQLAEMIGREGKQSVCNYEKRRCNPTAATLAIFCEKLGLEPSELMPSR